MTQHPMHLSQPVRVTIVGAGYVGLVTAAGLAQLGASVALVDTDRERIARLTRGESVIHEPGLDALLAEARAASRLRLTSELADALPGADVVFLAVPTPMGADGRADLRYVFAAADEIGALLSESVVLVTKSTVPVGTGEAIDARIGLALARRRVSAVVHVAANPEFLREGSAVRDVLHPDRLVVGTSSPIARAVLHRLYRPLTDEGIPLLDMDVRSAELAKYAANCMLASRISMMNQFAAVCDATGADIERVRDVLASDSRIGPAFLQAGLGFGGSCFPKDVTAFSRQASDYGVATPMLDATLAVNDAVRERAVGRLAEHLDLVGARVAVWGLAFKADTDDVRESPALRVIDDLLAAGAAVTVHDPVALVNLPDRLRQWVRCAASPLDAAEGADAVILATGWAAYGTVPARSLAAAMRGRLVLDGRGTLDAAELSRHGLTVLRVGRPTVSSSGARRAVSAA